MNNEITAILNDDDLSRGETTPRSTKDLFGCLSFWHYKASGLDWSKSIATHNSHGSCIALAYTWRIHQRHDTMPM